MNLCDLSSQLNSAIANHLLLDQEFMKHCFGGSHLHRVNLSLPEKDCSSLFPLEAQELQKHSWLQSIVSPSHLSSLPSFLWPSPPSSHSLSLSLVTTPS
jgi:hypothetical protein